MGEEHPHTLLSMSKLAETLRTQGDLTAAQPLQQHVLTTSRRVLGEQHSLTLAAEDKLEQILGAGLTESKP